ncbi:efflux RND transporter periplasmic adaptor subunit [Pseudodonghicola xiamenensis]|uniref:RND transporter n=1 Tax=Pseudodonghicola xiamenensis TaxID=337702 RepID=A0A8J3ME28_9RHOB|nr:efflux RND transporter periplasmic adaptor subunit [Pseudodonghicola xiamenensis]GHG94066.1 RND transporter [Pseudodonghicola xiamenensis]
MTRRTAPPLALWLGAGLTALIPLSAPAEQLLTIETAIARSAPLAFEFEISGTIEATENVPVSFRSGGRVVAVNVQVGDHVAEGEILATVDPTQAQAAARAAEAQLAAAEASLNQAQLAHDRAKELADRGAGTRAGLDAATQTLLAALSSRDQAEAVVSKARQAVSDTVIYAPASGIVTERSVEPGQVVSAAQAVLTLARDGLREAVFHIPDLPEANAFLGQRLLVRTLDGPERLFDATVSELSPLADENSGTVELKAKLDGEAEQPGLGAAVSSTFQTFDTMSISLPWSALAVQGTEPAVWVVDPDSHAVSLTPVTILSYTSSTIELEQELPEGTIVATTGSNLLFPGRIVRPLSQGDAE